MQGKHPFIYKVRRAKSRPLTYTIQGEKETLGSLTHLNRHGATTQARVENRTFSFKRKKIFKKDIHIHEHADALPIALFAGDLLSRGSLKIDNATYRWAPTNKLMTSWAWYNNEGEEVLRVRPQLHFFNPRAEIRAEHPLSSDTEKLLALLGWHLTLLGHQDPGSHLLASFEIYFGTRARVGV